jgi:hypothetical protein
MKKILHFTIAGLAWLAVLATPLARAWTYSDEDVLLIFRGQTIADDVEFDIGQVSQFTSPANSTIHVTSWNASLVTGTLGANLNTAGVSYVLAATTGRIVGPCAWLSSSDTSATVKDLTLSAWTGELYDYIEAIGTYPVNYGNTTASANAYVIEQFGDQAAGASSLASYDYIVSNDGQNLSQIAYFGGNVSFDVQGSAPGTVEFWQINTSSSNPKPAATFIGTFDLDANNNLYFYAASVSLQPAIVGAAQSADQSTYTVRFTTLANGSYSLFYSPDETLPISDWVQVVDADNNPITVAGNGGTQSASFPNPGDSADYFIVVRSP